MTLHELAEAFLAANKNRLSPNTLRAYGYDLGLLARELSDIAADGVTIIHLRAFLQATAELAPSTLARRQATLRACFAWGYKNDLLSADPTVKLEPVRLQIDVNNAIKEACTAIASCSRASCPTISPFLDCLKDLCSKSFKIKCGSCECVKSGDCAYTDPHVSKGCKITLCPGNYLNSGCASVNHRRIAQSILHEMLHCCSMPESGPSPNNIDKAADCCLGIQFP